MEHENKNEQVCFISGHTDISNGKFQSYYQAKIDHAIASNHEFVIGCSKGTDRLAFEYLVTRGAANRITIYMCEYEVDQFIKYFQSRGASLLIMESYLSDLGDNTTIKTCQKFKTLNQRDEAMTLNSDYDIAYVRTKDEAKEFYGPKYKSRITGTEKNLIRRVTKANRPSKTRLTPCEGSIDTLLATKCVIEYDGILTCRSCQFPVQDHECSKLD